MDRHQLKTVVNLLNLSTPLGFLLGALGGARFQRAPRGLVVAAGHRLPVRGSAVTVGNVVLTKGGACELLARQRLLAHEERHSWQYVCCLGLPMLPLYAVAAGWSWLRGGDVAVHNPFERLAGLADGGYPELSRRRRRRAAPAAP